MRTFIGLSGLFLLTTYAPRAFAQSLEHVEVNGPSTDDDNDGYTENAGDCDDSDPDVQPDTITVSGMFIQTALYTDPRVASTNLTGLFLLDIKVCGTFNDTLELDGVTVAEVNFYQGSGFSGVTSGAGLSLSNTYGVTVNGGMFLRNSIGIAGLNDEATTVSAPLIRQSTSSGVELVGSTDASIVGATVNQNVIGVLLDTVTNVAIDDTYFNRNQTGVYSTGGAAVEINNTQLVVNDIGITFSGDSSVSVDSSTVRGATTAAILVDSVPDVLITGTTITDSAIGFDSSYSYTELQNTVFRDNTIGVSSVESDFDIDGGRIVGGVVGVDLSTGVNSIFHWTIFDRVVMSNGIDVRMLGGVSYTYSGSVSKRCFVVGVGRAAPGACY